MKEFPIVRVEIERMCMQIKQALLNYSGQMNEAIENQIKKLLDGEEFIKFISYEIDRQIGRVMKEEIESYFYAGEGREAISKAVNSAFSKDSQD